METDQSQVADSSVSSEKSPIIGGILSWFIPGVGHYYLGMTDRAIKVFVAVLIYYVLSFVLMIVAIGFLLLFVAPLVHIAAGADAYLQGNK